MAINSNIQGLPYWNMFIDVQADGQGFGESSLWKYFGSYWGDPDNKYQISGGLFGDWWEVPHIDKMNSYRSGRSLTKAAILAEAERTGKTITRVRKDSAFTFNGFGYLRGPWSTSDAPRVVRNPGRLGGGNIPMTLDPKDVTACYAGSKLWKDWDECVNRPFNGMHFVPHTYMGSFDDDDLHTVFFWPKLMATLSVLLFSCYLVVVMLRFLGALVMSQDAKAIATNMLECRRIGWAVWTGLTLVAFTMSLTYYLNHNLLVLGVTGQSLPFLAASGALLPGEYSNDLVTCPKPGSCIVGKTKPQDCRCEYQPGSLATWLVGGQSFGSNSDYFDATTSPNDPIFFFQHAYYIGTYFTWAARYGYKGTERLTKENNFGDYPTGPEAKHIITGECYGHKLGDAVNHNFCYTKHDLGIPDSRAACYSAGDKGSTLTTFAVNFGSCCSHQDVLGFVHDPSIKPITYDFEVESHSWHAVEPKERCSSSDCEAEYTGDIICVKNPLYEQVDDELCSARTKPKAPIKKCDCMAEANRDKAYKKHEELGANTAIVDCTFTGIVLLVILFVVAAMVLKQQRKNRCVQSATTNLPASANSANEVDESESLIESKPASNKARVRRRSQPIRHTDGVELK